MTCNLYLLHVKPIVIPVFNSLYRSFSYSVCKVTTGTYRLKSNMLHFKLDGLFTAATAGTNGLPP